MPGFPGEAWTPSRRVLWLSFQASACSRPPDPTMSTFTAASVLASSAAGSGRPAEAGCAGLCRTGAAQTRQLAQPSARDRGIDHLGLRGWPFEVGVRDRVAV